MPRTPRLTPSRARILAFAGTAAALAGAGTAAAASASAATTPHTTPAAAAVTAVTPRATTPALSPGPGGGLGAGLAPFALTGTGPATTLTPATGTPATSTITPATATADSHPHAARTGHPTHATTITTTRATPAPGRHHATRTSTWHGNYQIYDSVTPAAIPGGKAAATYADGPYAATPSQTHGHSSITWIDTTTTDPHGATALDVEPGDATPAQAATWTAQRLDYHPHALAIIYTMRSDWTATQTAISTLPHWMHSHVRWWIADPTGTPHIVPGSSATQWYWGTSYDISTATPNF